MLSSRTIHRGGRSLRSMVMSDSVRSQQSSEWYAVAEVKDTSQSKGQSFCQCMAGHEKGSHADMVCCLWVSTLDGRRIGWRSHVLCSFTADGRKISVILRALVDACFCTSRNSSLIGCVLHSKQRISTNRSCPSAKVLSCVYLDLENIRPRFVKYASLKFGSVSNMGGQPMGATWATNLIRTWAPAHVIHSFGCYLKVFYRAFLK